MRVLIGLISVLLLGFAPVNSLQDLRLSSHEVIVAGTSSLHDWESKVTKVSGVFSGNFSTGSAPNIKKGKVWMEVESIESGKSVMDKKTFEAFDSKKNPKITFNIEKTNVKGNQIEFIGQMTMAGKTRPEKITASYKWVNGKLRIDGSHKIDMTQYGMTTPTAMMGTIKVGPEVTVKFLFEMKS